VPSCIYVQFCFLVAQFAANDCVSHSPAIHASFFQVLRAVPEEQQRFILKCFWACMNAIVVSTEAGFPPELTMQLAFDKYNTAVDSDDMRDGAVPVPGERPLTTASVATFSALKVNKCDRGGRGLC
jgi:hypothetical protein